MALSISIGLGSLLLYSAVFKSHNVELSAALLQSAGMPGDSARVVWAAVALELLLGSVLIAGLAPRAVMLAAAGALVVFTGVLFLALLRGHTGACGCLSRGGTVHGAILRNAGLLLACGLALLAMSPTPSSESLKEV